MLDVDLSYENAEPRPTLIAHEVSGLTLEDVRLQQFAGVPLLRLTKIDKLQMARCPGLPDQTIERVELAEK
jgi:hypothetical protein